MKSIAIFNNKGGVGKTTLLCNLSASLALEKNKKILVVDADPQCNATQSMFSDVQIDKMYSSTAREFTIYSVIEPLSKGKGYNDDIRVKTAESFGLDIIPGDPRLALTEDLLAQDWASGKSGDVRGLRTTLAFYQLLNRLEEYDYVIFDMGPSLGSINRAILLSVDFFITPMSIDIFSLRAIENISHWMVDWKKKLHRGLEDIGNIDDLEVEYNFNLKFLGYVNQQYIAKTQGDQKRPVAAFERIIRRIPATIKREISDKLMKDLPSVDFNLGQVPNLHSLIPMSQDSRKPIFGLKARDGVRGGHFSRVKEFDQTIGRISDRVLENMDALDSRE